MRNLVSKIADLLRSFTDADRKKYFTSAVILAAGSGERFGQSQGRKQFVPLLSEPAVVHTIRAFENCSKVNEILLIVREEDIPLCEEYRTQYGFHKITKILAGGADRQASAKIGLDAISEKAKYIAIHDGARCLITEEQIESVIRAAYEYGAAIAGTPSRDTVKEVSAETMITKTPDRSSIWLAQTPQVFLANMYRAAVYTAEKDGIRATDDSMLAERLGFQVKMVDCGSENFKLTWPEDVKLAETILLSRKESSEA